MEKDNLITCFKYLSKNIVYKKRKGMSVLLLAFSIMATLALAEMVVDLGLILNCRFEFQKALQQAALNTITDFELYENSSGKLQYPSTAVFTQYAQDNLNAALDAFKKSNSSMLKSTTISGPDNLPNPRITFDANARANKAIMIEATAVANTYFLKVIGINSIKLSASAAAVNIPAYIKSGSVLFGVVNPYRDSDLRAPLGSSDETINNVEGMDGADTTLYPRYNENADYRNMEGPPDAYSTSLGPGGYVTIKLPQVLVDGKGFDLQILTRGNANGYMVFAGNDIDPYNPYVNAANPGGGINWVNISCTGVPIGVAISNTWSVTNSHNGASINKLIASLPAGVQRQGIFYGSGYFDLNTRCMDNGAPVYDGQNNSVGSIHIAKYLKIVDDNEESGFVIPDPQYSSQADFVYKAALFPGQSSSVTPGVSIDSIATFHHPKLISKSDFNSRNAIGMMYAVMNLYKGQVDDYLKFWGCSAESVPADNWANCQPVIDDSVSTMGGTTGIRMGYANPNIPPSENPPKMLIRPVF